MPLKLHALFIATLAALPAWAGKVEVSAFLGRQSYPSEIRSIPSLNWNWSYSNADKTVYGLRVGYTFLDTGALRLNASAAFQPQISTDLKVNVMFGGAMSTLNSSYEHGYTGLGTILTFKAPVTVGLGLDYRFEKVTMAPASNISGGSGSSMTGGSSSFGRLWARFSLGHDFKGDKVSPFLGLEGDFALTSSGDLSATSSSEDVARSLSPKSQIGAYVGIRF